MEIAEIDRVLVEAVDSHLSDAFGPSEGIRPINKSEFAVVHLHYFGPTREFPWWTVATSGMSQRAMNPPSGAEHCTHAELILHLPADWDFDSDGGFWPLNRLGYYAYVPHNNETFLWHGHTIPETRETLYPMPKFVCGLITAHCLKEVDDLALPDGRLISFFNVAFLFKAEMELKVKEGTQALMERMERKGLTLVDLLVVNTNRKNACANFLGR